MDILLPLDGGGGVTAGLSPGLKCWASTSAPLWESPLSDVLVSLLSDSPRDMKLHFLPAGLVVALRRVAHVAELLAGARLAPRPSAESNGFVFFVFSSDGKRQKLDDRHVFRGSSSHMLPAWSLGLVCGDSAVQM